MKRIKFKVDGGQALDGFLLNLNKDEHGEPSSALVQIIAPGPVHNRWINAADIVADGEAEPLKPNFATRMAAAKAAKAA